MLLAAAPGLAEHGDMQTSHADPKVDQTRGTPTISRVEGDTIIELVYDAERRMTGLAVARFGGLWNIEQEVRLGTGEVLVPYSLTNTLIAGGSVLFASQPEHHGNKAELLADVEAYLSRYVDLSATFLRIAAHYVLLSWVYDAFNELPYLRFQGDYGTGKTRALLAIGLISYKPFFASGASTVSPIFHILDTFGGTLILDEADFRFSDVTSELVKILNNGNMAGLPVLRTMQNRFRELNPRAFRVFGPKIIAMRGGYDDEGLESRFLSENMNGRQMRADIPIHTPPEMRTEALALRNRLLHFRLTTLFGTRIDPSLMEPALEPRLNQIALPLLSVVDDSSVRAGIVARLTEQSESSLGVRRKKVASTIIAVLHDVFSDETVPSASVQVIAQRVNEELDNAGLSIKEVARVMRRQFGIRIHKSAGVHVVSRSEFLAINVSK